METGLLSNMRQNDYRKNSGGMIVPTPLGFE